MRYVLTILVLIVCITPAKAQTFVRTEPIFGKLLHNKDLQKDLQLTEKQIERMWQIHLQQVPISEALELSRVRTALELTNEQLRQIDDVKREALFRMRDQLVKLRSEGTGAFDSLRTAQKETQEFIDKSCQKLLTDRQREIFKKLQGPPYPEL